MFNITNILLTFFIITWSRSFGHFRIIDFEHFSGKQEYGRSSLGGIIRDYFNDSYMSAVSAFVKEEKISVDELKELIEKIESNN